jgi:hypothetical protein
MAEVYACLQVARWHGTTRANDGRTILPLPLREGKISLFAGLT